MFVDDIFTREYIQGNIYKGIFTREYLQGSMYKGIFTRAYLQGNIYKGIGRMLFTYLQSIHRE